MPLNDQIEVPQNILVRCPLRQFAQRRARHCDGCKHFAGLTEALGNGNLPFHKRFLVRCGWPIDRELSALAED